MKHGKEKLFICLLLIVLNILLLSISVSAADAGTLEVNVNETYTTGSPVVIKFQLTDKMGKPIELADPKSIKIEIEKPNGNKIQSTARQSGWNKPGEYYDMFTIDILGTFNVTAIEESTGLKGSASFNSVFATPGSSSIIILGVVMIIGAVVYWKSQKA